MNVAKYGTYVERDNVAKNEGKHVELEGVAMQ